MTTWSIGETAEKCGLSQHTLRWYERIGLLGAIERGGDGRRRFSDRDLDWLSLLIKLRATGMPVRDMQRYAELVRSGAGEAERIELLKRHREEVRRALATQRECLKLLDAKISHYSSCLSALESSALESSALESSALETSALETSALETSAPETSNL